MPTRPFASRTLPRCFTKPAFSAPAWNGYVSGAAIHAASTLLSLRQLAPGLAKVGAAVPANPIDFFANVPWLGSIMHGMIEGSGLVGLLATACLFGAIAAALTAPREGNQKNVSWALAHGAMGLCQGIGMFAGIGLFSPLGMGLLGAQLGLSWLLQQKVQNGQSSWLNATLAIGISLAVGPAGGQLLIGASEAAIAGSALRVLGFAGIAAAVYGLYLRWPMFVDESATYAKSFMEPRDLVWAHRLENHVKLGEQPTVFEVPSAIDQLIVANRARLHSGQPMGLQKVLLTGPSGTGKTVTAQAMASALGANFLNVDHRLNVTRVGNSAVSNVLDLFAEARLLVKETKRPLVIFIDEADVMFTNRDMLERHSEDGRERGAMVKEFLTELEGVRRRPDDNMMVIAATNYPDRLDRSIRQRFAVQVPTAHPSLRAVRATLLSKLDLAYKAQGFGCRVDDLTLGDALLDSWAKHQHENLAVGRNIEQWVEALINNIYATVDVEQPKAGLYRGIAEATRYMLQNVDDHALPT